MQGFNERLKQLRLNKHMTLEALALKLETTKTTLSRYENARRQPDADFIAKTARFFNVSCDYLLKLTDHPTTVSDFLNNQTNTRGRLSADELQRMCNLLARDELDSI